MKKYEVIGIGTPVSDYVMNVESLPKSNQGARMLGQCWSYGGKVASAMAAIGRLGHTCAMMAVVGDDPDGHAQQRDFARNGVDTTYLKFKEGKETALCVVLADRETGGRSFLGAPRDVARMTIEDLDEEALKNTQYLHLESGADFARRAAEIVRAAGGQISVDADGYNEAVEAMIPLVDIYIPSEFYYKRRYGEERDPMDCCREIAAQGPHTVIITLGEKGCVGVSPAGEFRLPCFKVPVVDTTGAGDVFHGAFLHGMLKGWPAERAAEFASAYSAIKCTAMGGRAGLADEAMVERFLNNGNVIDEEISSIIAERLEHYKKMPYGV
ncbi:MAG: carbohydrate kinase family protein [Christensenellales bacterium]|jgi:sulfofructose kinase